MYKNILKLKILVGWYLYSEFYTYKCVDLLSVVTALHYTVKLLITFIDIHYFYSKNTNRYFFPEVYNY